MNRVRPNGRMRWRCLRTGQGAFLPLLMLGALAGPASARPRPAVASAHEVPGSPAVAIRDAAGGRLKRFYESRGYWPLWVRGGAIRPEAATLIGFLASADLDGLDPDRYDVAGLRHALADARSGAPEDLARAELMLSATFADYVRDAKRAPSVRITYLDPALAPARLREDEVLRTASLTPSFPAYVAAMGWMDPLYVQLRAGLGRFLAHHGPAETERIIRLNLARARILPGPWTRHVVVDAASARLYYYGGGKLQGTMRVVVGAPQSPTPMLAGTVRYAILNPYWNVPPDLVQRRVAPKILQGASLTALHYEALSGWGADAQTLDPAAIDWPAVASGAQELRVRQLPGATNAMGRMKFMFPNDLGIYLHDTPEKALMRRSARHLSNGCVRLEDAPRLGRWFFGRPLAVPSPAPEQDIALPQPVPVYLTYLTAVPSAGGVTLLSDAYGRDGAGGR